MITSPNTIHFNLTNATGPSIAKIYPVQNTNKFSYFS